MSKVLIAIGIIVVLASIAAGGMIYTTPGQMQVMGITPEVAAVLLVGGFTIVGLGAVTAAIETSSRTLRDLRVMTAQADRAPPPEPVVDLPTRGEEPVVAAAAAAAIAVEPEPTIEPEPGPPPPSAVDALIAESRAAAEKAIAASKEQAAETVVALDKAKDDLSKALNVPEPAAESAASAIEDEAAEDSEDSQLYVVEERLIRGRPARVLSDGTVEAETDEGWMRFENLEHLEEYLDAMSPGAA
jgi:hypothetical protein